MYTQLTVTEDKILQKALSVEHHKLQPQKLTNDEAESTLLNDYIIGFTAENVV